jgi:hypothetical protein
MFRVTSVLLFVALMVPVAVSAQQSPTLGELALREEARRKALKAAAGKVVTNDDVPKGTPAAPAAGAPTVPPAAAPGAAEAPGAEKPADKPKEGVKDEAWWKQRVTQVRDELRRNEMFAEALQARINSLANDFAAQDDPYRRAEIAQERAKAIAELDRVKTDVDASRKTIADIEEEARRAGVPPGWLR